ncbi:MAG: tRNA (adenosine(37)-N6)-dimethylallyltransferase MiaA [bacterium]|nr:tRNA (adenosine(37)-N6)-dimethylallyltransferase MiaA [bacterium]
MKQKGGKLLPKVLFIVGPTASGKTKLALELAKEFKGEIINADARQVYRGLSIGTGKPMGEWKTARGNRAFFVEGVAHHLMDFVSSQKSITVAEWRKKAIKTISDIVARHHLPIVVGGTGLYVQSLLDNLRIPAVPPDASYRTSISQKTLPELVMLLSRMDPEGVKIIDTKNPRRVIRALEIITYTGLSLKEARGKNEPLLDPLVIGLMHDKALLHDRIDQTIDRMMQEGWLQEVRGLLKKGIPLTAVAMSSIGYRELADVVVGKRPLEEAVVTIRRATKQYAKRQMTWFKRDVRIHWMSQREEGDTLLRSWLHPRTH